MKKVLIIGATSAIASATAKIYAAERAEIFLAARNKEAAEKMAEDLIVRGASRVRVSEFDALNPQGCSRVLAEAEEFLKTIEVALIAHGSLPDHQRCIESLEETERELRVNFLSVVAILTDLANMMEKGKGGCIAVISSVAGDRGRQSNYVYGAAKGGLTIFLQGLRNRLSPNGVHVLTIKPGFVSTPMTAHLPQGPLFADAERVGLDIYRAIANSKNVLYTPWFWRYIMLVIRHIPEQIFKRMKL